MSAALQPRLSSLLDLLRWLSAFAVVACHAAHLVVAHAGLVDAPGIALRCFYVLRDVHQPAVMVFFVLSGYLVGGAVIAQLRAGGFVLRRYLVDRCARLYLVLAPALALGALCDAAGLRWFDALGLYDDRFAIPDFDGTQVRANLGWTIAALNLANLQTILAPPLGSNLPLWSLANEFWYYLLCPLALIACARMTGWRARALAALGALAIALLISRGMLLYGAIWALGAWAAAWRGSLRLQPWLAAAALLAALGIDAAGAIPHWLDGHGLHAGRLGSFIPDLLVAGAACALILAVRASPDPQRPLPGERLHRFMAGFSYSLYLGHYPFILLALAAWLTWTGSGVAMPPGPGAFLLVAAVVALAYAWCFGLSLASERHTAGMRAWLRARLCGAPAPAAPAVR